MQVIEKYLERRCKGAAGDQGTTVGAKRPTTRTRPLLPEAMEEGEQPLTMKHLRKQ